MPAFSTRERKRRTRRLILMGSYLEHVTKTDPHSLDRLMKGLDEFLERDRDRGTVRPKAQASIPL